MAIGAALMLSTVPATASPVDSGVEKRIATAEQPKAQQSAKTQQSAVAQQSAMADGWRDGGRITGPRDGLLMDSSTSHIVVAVGTTRADFEHPRATSTIARRTPNGHWTRANAHIGDPVAVDVNAAGDAVIISVRNRERAVIATRWSRSADHFRSKVILKAADAPYPSATRVSVNGHGDIAVLVTAYAGYGDRALLLRKLSGEPWKRTLTIRPNRYDGALDSIDITPTGSVVGAFKRDQTLSVRTMRAGGNVFGRASEVTTWPAIDDGPRDYAESYTQIKVGVNGDLATAWSYGVLSGEGGSELVTIRINIVPARGRPWQRQLQGGDRYVDLVTVGRDASVIIDEVYTSRWTRASRSFTTIPEFFRDANEQGDVLLGGGIYGGPLRLWQVGKAPGAESPPPAGKTYSSVLTADQRVYVAQLLDSRRAHGYYLKIRQL